MRTLVTRTVQGLTVDIDCDVTPFVPGVHTLSNGDPGYPDEGGEVEILSITTPGDDQDLTEYLSEYFLDAADDAVSNLAYPSRDDEPEDEES